MEPTQLEKLREKLIQEKEDALNHEAQNENYGLDNSMRDSIGELSTNDNHPADIGSEMFERGKDLALQDAEEHHLNDVVNALERIDEGTYGVCVVCKNEIPYERLEAVPWTRYCKEHNPQQHSSIRRPVEERALRSYTHSFRNDNDYIGYDGEDAWQDVERYGTSNPPDFFREGEDYNELWINSFEQDGYIDLTEGFAITDITGSNQGMPGIAHNEAYRRKALEEYEGSINEDVEG